MKLADFARSVGHESPVGMPTWLDQAARPAYALAEIQAEVAANAAQLARPATAELVDRIFWQQAELDRMVKGITEFDAMSALQRQMHDLWDAQSRAETLARGAAQEVQEALTRSQSILEAVCRPLKGIDLSSLYTGPSCGGVADILKSHLALSGILDSLADLRSPSALGRALAEDANLIAGHCAWLAGENNLSGVSSACASALGVSAWRNHFVSLDAVTNIVFTNSVGSPLKNKEDGGKLREEVDRQVESSLAELLKDFPPEFLRWWQAANQAARSKNPDNMRHAAVSLRMLMNRIIDQLAPRDVVCGWDHPKDFRRSDGKASLEVRLLYVVRGCDSPPLASMVSGTIASGMALATFLNQGVHEDETQVDAFGLRLLLRRVECTLCDLIDASRLFRG